MAREIPEDEMKVRVDLAACYRLVDHYGMSDLLGTHISARVPGTDDEFLLNPYGVYFEEMTASALLRVNMDGEVLDDSNYSVNSAGFTIHSAILGGRSDINCALHTHTVAGMAVGAMEEGLLPMTQTSMQFYKRLAYHDYEGGASREGAEAECARLQKDLGPKDKAMVLRNHGLLTCGETVADAFRNIKKLEHACEVQMHACAMRGEGQTLRLIDEDVCEEMYQVQEKRGTTQGDMGWPGHLRRLDREDPSFRN
ncbi:MAG: class II aldolase/adducin family protein [Alphaproteobacteria bacterium]|nr:class II aldolase/adducin family protein [Alphaproteobacteria bacterium]